MTGNRPDVELRFNESAVDEIFASLDQERLPGAAVGIAIGGETVYRKGFGLANMELPVKLSPTIKMRIGSITKHFTCLAYMLLCERGLASVDDKLDKHLPGILRYGHDVTMRHLMTHVSGIRDVVDICLKFSGLGLDVSSEALLASYTDIDDGHGAPGASWIYNNGAYLLLTAAIEKIAGRSLEVFLEQEIFTPIGMFNTMLRRSDNGFVANSAALHMTQTATDQKLPTDIPPEAFYKLNIGASNAGEGGIVSTIDDMLLWLAHMRDPIVGSKKTWSLMLTPQVLENGTSTGYGLGLMLGGFQELEAIRHPGGLISGNAEMLRIPSHDLNIIVISNRGDVWSTLLAEEIIQSCIDVSTGREPSPCRSITPGVYRSKTTGRVVELKMDGFHYSASVDNVDVALAVGDGFLYPSGVCSYLKQRILPAKADGFAPEIDLIEYGNHDHLVQVDNASTDKNDEGIIGRYVSITIGVTLIIFEQEGGLRLRSIGMFGTVLYELIRLADGVYRARLPHLQAFGGIITFDEDRSELYFSDGYYTRRLRFKRFLL